MNNKNEKGINAIPGSINASIKKPIAPINPPEIMKNFLPSWIKKSTIPPKKNLTIHGIITIPEINVVNGNDIPFSRK
jgi:hypothetical protein